MCLSWGVTPVWIARESTTEDLFDEAVRVSEEAGYIKKGDTVVITAGVPLGVSGRTNMIRVVEV
jgi:pyruvate kinase